jgi:hypothetical protein
MMKNIFFLIFPLFLVGCQHTTDIDDFLDNGISSVTIENVEYVGSAYLSSLKIVNYNFRSIILKLNDTTKIEILSEKFDEGIFSCNPTQSRVIFSLEYDRLYKSFYFGEEGFLYLKKVNSEQIVGEFDIVVYDVTSSCSNCPDDMMKTKGKFNAIKI